MLDVVSTTRGLLIPRMTTLQKNAITLPATGLMVFDITLGAYYSYTGTAWIPFLDSKLGWALAGNALTTPGTDFIGTTDAQDLVFKTAGVERMRINAAGNFLGIGTSVSNVGIDLVGIDAFTADLAIERFSTNIGPSYLEFYKARGTRATPLSIASGDNIEEVDSYAYTGAVGGWRTVSSMYTFAAAAPVGGKIKTSFGLNLDDGVNASPTTRIFINGNGEMSFGGNGSGLVGDDYDFSPVESSGVGQTKMTIISYDNTPTSASALNFAHARGSLIATTATIIGDMIGEISVTGYDGTNWTRNHAIRMYADETYGVGTGGVDLRFYTSSTVGASEAMRFDKNQVATFFAAPNSNVIIDASGSFAGDPNIKPSVAGTLGAFGYGNVGNVTNWWDRMYSEFYFIDAGTFLLFDTYDDIALLNNIKSKTYWDADLQHHIMVMDSKTLPLCVTNYKERLAGKTDHIFVDVGNMTGLLIGVSKQINNESNQRDQRLNDRTELLAQIADVHFDNTKEIVKKISDMGQSILKGKEFWVSFDEEFIKNLDKTPIVTASSNSLGKNIYVTKVSKEGFMVVAEEATSAIHFSWIAMGKKTIQTDHYNSHIEDVFYREKIEVKGDYPVYNDGSDTKLKLKKAPKKRTKATVKKSKKPKKQFNKREKEKKKH